MDSTEVEIKAMIFAIKHGICMAEEEDRSIVPFSVELCETVLIPMLNQYLVEHINNQIPTL